MYQRILVPLDGSDTSLAGLDEAVRLARLHGATLRLVHAFNTFKLRPGHASHASYSSLLPKMKAEGEELLQRGRERAERGGAKVETMLLTSLTLSLSELVAEDAQGWKADLIVAGTRGRKGIERILWGSQAQDVTRMATMPVLLVQAPETDTND
ncbi:universal stress protein [Variovorax sp. J22R24]|uniref:universal stress protein n=1 Tax=Variovorax gracilis TaxID=3053502 RepID=UPI002578E0F3|nr:universal stress protein [Variovorax sp. J22R24]MDM0106990.1 universal stress protein [Variovorax sp. J22R24]